MKILYDHQMFTLQRYGGITRYFYEIMNQFNLSKLIEYDLGLKYSDNEYLKNSQFLKTKGLLLKFYERKIIFKRRLFYFLNNLISKKLLKESNYNIFHPTYYDTYFLKYIVDKPFVITIHDMIPEKFPEFYKERWKGLKGLYFKSLYNNLISSKKELARKATKIIAVSENTKKDIIDFYKVEERKIKVIYHGNSLKETTKSMSNNITLPNKYLFFVGSRNGYKNFRNFIESIVKTLKHNNDLSVVCAGGGKFTYEEVILFKSLNIDKKMYQYDVNDDTLFLMYKNATAFIFPSIYEGFGIPIIEAFSCGCPTILSKSSCFPEIALDSAIYFDPYNKESIKESIERLIYSKKLREELIKKGFERIKYFSWEKAAEETFHLYDNITNNTLWKYLV